MIIILPNGDGIDLSLIKNVFYYDKKKYVVGCDVLKTGVAFIKVKTDEEGNAVRALLIRAVNDGDAFTQPDWSFMT